MKRLLAAAILLLMPVVAFAFDPNKRPQTDDVRIAILRTDGDITRDEILVREKVVHYLTHELKSRGIDAYETDWSYEDAAHAENADVDYYVEVIGAGSNSDAVGGVDIAGRHADVSIGVIVSQVAAEVRLYDAQTMDVVASENIAKRKSAVRPTSIGIGGADLFAWIAIPIFERQQVRSAAKAAAHDAAMLIADAVK